VLSIKLYACQFAERVCGGAVERAPAERAGGVVVLPGVDADGMEILLAGAAILQFLVFLIHLGEADGAVCVILEIDILGVLSGSVHPGTQSFGELFVQYLVGGLRNLGNSAAKIVKQFLVLGDLRDNEEDVLAGLLLHLKVKALAGYGR
jgi:hypothetical protein